MANEVEIRVTSRNQAKPGLVEAERDLDRMGKAGVKAGDAVAASMQRMTNQVTAAQSRLAKAREAESLALAAQITAQAALEKERQKATVDTDKLAAAQHRLDAALSKVKRAQDEVGRSSSTLQKAQSELAAAGERIGRDMAQGIAKGSASTLARVGPGLGPALIPAAALAGSAAGAALVTGFGVGVAGLGIKAAAQTEHVKTTFTNLRTDLGNDFKRLSEPFGQTLLDISGQARATFGVFRPALEDAMKTLAPGISKFTGDIAHAFQQFEPAVRPISRATNAVLRDLGGRLPGVVAGLSREFEDLAEAIEENPEALGDIAVGAGKAGEAILTLMAALTKLYTPVREGIGWLADLNDAIIDLTGQDESLKWSDQANETADAAKAASEEFQSYKISVEDAAAAQEAAAKAAADHAKELNDLTSAVLAQIDADLALRQSKMDSKDAITEYNEAVKENGSASREAAEALLGVEQAAAREMRAVIDATLAKQEAAGRARDLAGANIAARDALNRLAADAKGPARDGILAQVAALNDLIAKLRAASGDFYARVHVSTSGQPTRFALGAMQSRAHGGVVSAAASGGPRGNRVLVGEQGPEVVDLAPGSMVHTAGATQRMLTAAAQPAAPFGEFLIPMSDSVIGRLLLDLLQEAAKRQGFTLVLAR